VELLKQQLSDHQEHFLQHQAQSLQDLNNLQKTLAAQIQEVSQNNEMKNLLGFEE
jgi:hypothetical protein